MSVTKSPDLNLRFVKVKRPPTLYLAPKWSLERLVVTPIVKTISIINRGNRVAIRRGFGEPALSASNASRSCPLRNLSNLLGLRLERVTTIRYSYDIVFFLALVV